MKIKWILGLVAMLVVVGLSAPPTKASCFECYFTQLRPVPIDDDGNPLFPETPDVSGTYEDPVGPCTAEQMFSCENVCYERMVQWNCSAHRTFCSARTSVDGGQYCYCEFDQCRNGGDGTPAPAKKEVVAWDDGIINCHDPNWCP
jgi:hypothetical protein